MTNNETTSVKTISDWAAYIHAWARRKKWWSVDESNATIVNRDILGLLMLVVTELAEAAEEYRNGYPAANVYAVTLNGERLVYAKVMEMSLDMRMRYFATDLPKPEGLGVELADTIIRILDMAQALGIEIQATMALKMRYNETRPERHGGKLA